MLRAPAVDTKKKSPGKGTPKQEPGHAKDSTKAKQSAAAEIHEKKLSGGKDAAKDKHKPGDDQRAKSAGDKSSARKAGDEDGPKAKKRKT